MIDRGGAAIFFREFSISLTRKVQSVLQRREIVAGTVRRTRNL